MRRLIWTTSVMTIQLVYKSGAVVEFETEIFEGNRDRTQGLTEVEWGCANLRNEVLYINPGEVQAIFQKGYRKALRFWWHKYYKQ